MRILNEYWPYLTPSKFISILVFFLFLTHVAEAQNFHLRHNYSFTSSAYSVKQDTSLKSEFPDPKSVMRQSLIIPGWGQITNKQAWKVPIVYGLLGGLTYYSVYLTKQYHDYRAAYYNLVDTSGDLRFGPTPGYLVNQSASSLQSNRNFLRNRRDFIYVTIGLAYMLNVVDAYVYAHFRSFDVSDDLSVRPGVGSEHLLASNMTTIPVIRLKLSIK